MDELQCELCSTALKAGEGYVVEMAIYAHPEMPAMTKEEAEEASSPETWEKLMRAVSKYSAEELQEQIYRKFQFRICWRCQKMVLVNPLGKPRTTKLGQN